MEKGPDFIQQTECEQPIKTDCKSKSISDCIDVNRYSSYTKLMHITASLMRVSFDFSKSAKPSLGNALNVLNDDSIKQARTLWIQEAQARLNDQIEKESYKRLNLREGEDGITVVRGRTGKWIEIN